MDTKNPESIKNAQAFRDENARLALSLGGTCTGEHGIGIGKKHLLVEEVGEATINVMRKIKKTLDPNYILNPGKVFSKL